MNTPPALTPPRPTPEVFSAETPLRPLREADELKVDRPAGPQAPHMELRRHARYLISQPITAIPVRADGGPDTDHVLEGVTVDISAGGVGFEIPGEEPPAAKTVVVGIESSDGKTRFRTGQIRYCLKGGIGMRIGASFVAEEHDLLREERLLPAVDAQTFTLTAAIREDALAQWGMLGVVRPVPLDRVQVCFQCGGLPTFRLGCAECGSARTKRARLIHHFACAHVGFAEDFEADGGLKCPKCRLNRLVVGSDFELLDGPHRCLDCSWTGAKLESIAQCLNCRVRFPAHRVLEKEVLGYHVCRLDPLAFVPQS